MVSHTNTGEWKSFEIRMRRRKAERLLVRAEVAADAGCFDDARAAVDEARHLWPGAPALALLEHRIATASRGDTAGGGAPPRTPRGARRTERIAAGATVALVIATVSVAVVLRLSHSAQTASSGVAVSLSVPPTTRGSVQPRGGNASAPASVPAHAIEPRVPDADSNRVEMTSGRGSPEPAHEGKAPDSPATVGGGRSMAAPASESPVASAPAVVPGESMLTPDVLPPSTASARGAAFPEASASDRSPASPAGVSPAGVSPAGVPPASVLPASVPLSTADIRATLDGYAAAYSSLDADAARRVWPSVNRAALARAFDSLATQRVSFDDCRIEVQGSAARARCTGSATWAPKVGGRGERTDARSWTFDLEKSGDRWQIAAARVQNR